ncbi:uncharacterized protein LOC143294031 isoform X2 [Babylonia areolata]|uniref:uncharacterized protein LOC143294031 isoform X2 n=1 Tax=Babylonia areolata TaxID=304850 RepID=UPI003FD33011
MCSMLHPHWTSTAVRLIIWHFTRRIATAVSTQAHPLYPGFMCRLSEAIFAWDEGDFSKLLKARRAQLQEDFLYPCDAKVLKRITRRDLALHCKWVTSGVEETTRLIRELLEVYTSEQGKDSLGVPPLSKRLCLGDVAGAGTPHPLHPGPTQCPDVHTDRHHDEGWCLPAHVPLCKRLHIVGVLSPAFEHVYPSDSTNDVHYQAYLVEGLARWNQDRAAAALEGGKGQPRTYSGKLQQAVSKLSSEVLGRNLLPLFTSPRTYTGEKLGV